MTTRWRVQERPCPLCGCAESRLYREGNFTLESGTADMSGAFSCTNVEHGRHFPIRRCDSCQFVYCSPCPTSDSLEGLYSSVVDPTYVQFEDARRVAVREVIRRLPISSGRLLEVGCYTGIFLEEAQRAGFECYGIEPSRAAVDLCVERGLRVAQGFVDHPLPWDVKFDLVVMWDVLEHLHDPLNAVRSIRELVAPGGEFHFTTVRIDCMFARILGRRWPWFMPMHLLYFERHSLETMLRQAGFGDYSIGNNFHYSQVRYLEKKLKGMPFPLSVAGHLLSLLPNLTVRVSLGDTVYVRAKPLRN